jgi:NAD(P)-dependent dehydrogenase (short-subunit alcohol dehydrogenase family)
MSPVPAPDGSQPASAPMSVDLRGRVALVTGGASGIGLACARLLAANHASVVVADRNAAGAESAALAIVDAGGDALALRVEIGDSASVQTMVDQTLARYKQIDILVHCAGVSPRKNVVDMTDDDWHRVIAINLDGTMYVSRAVARHMLPRKRGTMILIASDRGLLGQSAKSAYAASKGGVIAFAKSLALELGPHEITVNALNPGTTDTPLVRSEMPQALWDQRVKADPLGKLSEPEDIAEIVLFLAGSAGRFMTGQLITTRMRFG